MLTHDRLLEVLSYDPETGVFSWKVARGCRKPGEEPNCTDRYGYKVIRVDGRLYRSHRLAWMYVNGCMPSFEIDHINGVRCDNRICNLRLANRIQNTRNSSIRIDNRSGVRGVTWDNTRQKWVAAIKVNGKKIQLGRFDSVDEAASARINSEHLHGEFASERGVRS